MGLNLWTSEKNQNPPPNLNSKISSPYTEWLSEGGRECIHWARGVFTLGNFNQTQTRWGGGDGDVRRINC